MDKTDRRSDQRRSPRAYGPFDAWRIKEHRTRVQVANLNIGGCVVQGAPEEGDPETYTLVIELGVEGEIEVTAAALYHVANGSAVAFLNASPGTIERIRQAVERLK